MRLRIGTVMLGLAVAAIALLPAGCGGDKADTSEGGATEAVSSSIAESIIEHAAKKDGQDVDVEIKGSGGSMSISVKGEEGSLQTMTGGASGPPQDMPQDVPLYPGLAIHMTHAASEQQAFNVTGETQAAVADVAAFYKKEAAGKGWTEQTSTQTNTGEQEMHMLMYRKENRMLHVMIVGESGKTTVTVTTALQ